GVTLQGCYPESHIASHDFEPVDGSRVPVVLLHLGDSSEVSASCIGGLFRSHALCDCVSSGEFEVRLDFVFELGFHTAAAEGREKTLEEGDHGFTSRNFATSAVVSCH